MKHAERRLPTRLFAYPAALALALGCSSGLEIITTCEDAGGIHAICGFQNPEDLALLSDGDTVVVSQFGGMEGEKPGNIAIFDLETEALRVAHKGHEGVTRTGEPTQPAKARGWGDPACPGPPPEGFAPHGIDVAVRPDGLLRLLVVNHGGREAIEIFQITGRKDNTRVVWRGCAIPPEGAFLNDVVSLPDGGFLATHMMDPDRQITDMLMTLLGIDSGWVYMWQPGSGYSVVAGTDSPFPNGIELSADGADIYLNLYLGNEVRRISRATGELLGSAQVRQPDNSSWGADGRLLVASHLAGLGDSMACNELARGACPFGFEIIAVDPKTMETEVVFANAGPPMGAATVAIDTGEELVLGSFAGDRIIRAKRRASSNAN